MPKQEMEKFDLGKLVAEAGAEVDALIKSEKERLEALKKSEESSSSSSSSMAKKEFSAESSESNLMNKKEGSESSIKKDENSSGYESQAPDAQSAAPAPSADPAASPAPAEDGAPPQESGEDLQSMVSSLDDQMLDELMQVVMMEKDARKGSASPEQQAAPAPSPSASPSAPPMDSASMAMKSEIEKYQEKLAKSEAKADDLQKSFTSMTELLDKMINRPVQKAVTDVRNMDYIDKGEKDLKKSEQATISDADLKKKAVEISADPKKLGALAKSERDVLLDFLVTKKRNPEVLKIVSK